MAQPVFKKHATQMEGGIKQVLSIKSAITVCNSAPKVRCSVLGLDAA
jgi:hypothetical protein